MLADNTSYSKEFADVLKKYLDTYPITARSLRLYAKVDSNNLERTYKDHLSGFRDWEQADHAEEWVLLYRRLIQCQL